MGARAGWMAMIVMAWVAGVAAQQAPADGKAADDKAADRKKPGPLTITGCVERGPGPNDFTVDDATAGKYRVSGSRVERYVGQRVEVVGTIDNKRLRIRGGLYPSPNAAGQAGAMDPVKAAMAGQPGGTAAGTGDIELPALKVRSLKTLGGGCR